MADHPSSSEKRALRKVVVVFKTHFDLGFTGLPDEVMALYTGRMFSAVREVVAATSTEPIGLRYNWTLPAWPLKQLLHDPSIPAETRAAARKMVEQGALSWHAWPFTTHTAFCGLEELVRGLHISRSLSEEFGRWPTGAKQTDVPGHTWILPSLLAGAGVKFLHLGCNSGSHPPHVPRLFWWEGPDGARLLTWYSPGGYGTPLLPPDDWPLDTWLAIQQTDDNKGPQSPEELRRIRETISKGASDAEVVFGELGDFAESLLEHPEQLDNLPVVPYDLADTWIHGIGTMPREVARVRELRVKLLALEQVAIVHDWPGWRGTSNSRDFPLAHKVAPLIDAAYEQLLLFGEHTWGLDVKSTIMRVYGEEFEQARQTESYKKLEASWKAKATYVDRAEALFAEGLNIVEGTFRGAKTVAPKGEQNKRDEVQISNTQKDTIENGWLRVQVDPALGAITSLLDKRTGRDWVDHGAPEPFGGYRYDIYSAEDIAEHLRSYGLYFQDWFVQDFGKQGYPEDSPHFTAYARNFTLSRQEDYFEQSLILTGGKLHANIIELAALPEQTISIKLTLRNGADPYVRLEYKVEGKAATPMSESSVVPFPFYFPKPTFRLGQVGSVIDPARDIAPGANRHLWCADWLDISDDRIGIALMPTDMPLLSIGDIGIYKFQPERVPSESLVYAHLSNTQWGTNFPQWLEGDFSCRINLLPHTGGWREGSLHEVGTTYDYSDLLLDTDVKYPISTRRGLRLLSMRPASSDEGILLRYVDTLGLHRRIEIALDGPVAAIWRCNLMEKPIEELKVQHENWQPNANLVEFDIDPHAIETLLIKFDTNRNPAQ